MRARIIKIGNARAVRLPATMLKAAGIKNEVELVLQPDGILIRPVQSPREGWAAAFRRMQQSGDDRPLDPGPSSSWDSQEWKW